MSTPMQTATRRSVTRRTTTDSGGGSSVGGGESSYNYRSRSPLSPAREVRLREKEEIAGLNSRLAQYIDVVRRLETENETLRIKISRSEETVTQERSHVRQMFETELTELRAENEKLISERAHLQSELDKLRAKIADLTPRIKELEKLVEDLKNKNRALEKALADKEAALHATERERDMLMDELADLSKDMDDLKNQLKSAQDQLEAEVYKRAEAESSLNSLEKKLNFEKNIFEETLRESSLLKITEIEEIERRKDNESTVRIETLLDDLRNQHEDKIEEYKREKEEFYNQKLVRMQQENVNRDRELAKNRRDLGNLRNENDNLMQEIMKLNDILRDRDGKVADLEKALMDEKANAADKENECKEELEKLRDTLMQQCDEYQDLLDEKLNLDLEISAYRKMLESEEQRMNLSPSPGRKRRLPGEAGEAGGRTKRRKMKTDEYFTSETVQSTKLIGLEIIEADPQGNMIAIQNHTNQEISLFNYELRRFAGGKEAFIMFEEDMVIQPKAITTVHSTGSIAALDQPPESIVAQNVQQWPVGEEFVTTLYDPEGQEVASRHCKRRITEEEHFELEQNSTEKCVIS